MSFLTQGDVVAPAATLTGTTLAANIIHSSLQDVGVLSGLTVTAPIAGSVTGSSGSTSGNAATATALATPRAINGVNFDGTAAITVTAAADTLSGATLAAGVTASSLTSVGTLTSLAVAGAVTQVTDLTTTGNTILGNASADTLNIGNGGLIKDANGNVGIGIAPTERLHVNGNVVRIGDGTYSFYLGKGNAVVGGGGAADTALWASVGNLLFATGSNTERMRIDESGNTGFGLIPSGSYKVEINGGLSISSATMLRSATSFTNGAAAALGTLSNAPVAGNPTKWIPVDDNGTVRYIPSW